MTKSRYNKRRIVSLFFAILMVENMLTDVFGFCVGNNAYNNCMLSPPSMWQKKSLVVPVQSLHRTVAELKGYVVNTRGGIETEIAQLMLSALGEYQREHQTAEIAEQQSHSFTIDDKDLLSPYFMRFLKRLVFSSNARFNEREYVDNVVRHIAERKPAMLAQYGFISDCENALHNTDYGIRNSAALLLGNVMSYLPERNIGRIVQLFLDTFTQNAFVPGVAYALGQAVKHHPQLMQSHIAPCLSGFLNRDDLSPNQLSTLMKILNEIMDVNANLLTDHDIINKFLTVIRLDNFSSDRGLMPSAVNIIGKLAEKAPELIRGRIELRPIISDAADNCPEAIGKIVSVDIGLIDESKVIAKLLREIYRRFTWGTDWTVMAKYVDAIAELTKVKPDVVAKTDLIRKCLDGLSDELWDNRIRKTRALSRIAKKNAPFLIQAGVVEWLLKNIDNDNKHTRSGSYEAINEICDVAPELFSSTESFAILKEKIREDGSVGKDRAEAIEIIGKIIAFKPELDPDKEIIRYLVSLLPLENNPHESIAKAIGILAQKQPELLSDVSVADRIVGSLSHQRRGSSQVLAWHVSRALGSVGLNIPGQITQSVIDNLLTEARQNERSHDFSMYMAEAIGKMASHNEWIASYPPVLAYLARVFDIRKTEPLFLLSGTGTSPKPEKIKYIRALMTLLDNCPQLVQNVDIVRKLVDVVEEGGNRDKVLIAVASLRVIIQKAPHFIEGHNVIKRLVGIMRIEHYQGEALTAFETLFFSIEDSSSDIYRRLKALGIDAEQCNLIFSLALERNLEAGTLLKLDKISPENKSLFLRYVKLLADLIQKQGTEASAILYKDRNIENMDFPRAITVLEEIISAGNSREATQIELQQIRSFADIASNLDVWRNNPNIREEILRRIIITMRLLRQRVGRNVFSQREDVELIMPRIRNSLEGIFGNKTLWSYADILLMKRFLKSINFGTTDRVDEMRQEAINLITVATGNRGDEIRGGSLVGVLRNEVHNFPSPMLLPIMQAYLDFVQNGRNAQESIRFLENTLRYDVTEQDYVSDIRRPEVMRTAQRLFDSINDIYGEGNFRTLRDNFREWSNSVAGEPQLKRQIGDILAKSVGQLGEDDYRALTEIRKKLHDIIKNPATSGNVVLNTIVFDNRLELLTYNISSKITAGMDLRSGPANLNLIQLFLENLLLNGYDREELPLIIREVSSLRGRITSWDSNDWLRLQSIVHRINQIIGEAANAGISEFQPRAERYARSIGVMEHEMGPVYNFSSNLFRGDTIYLFSLFLTRLQQSVGKECGRNGTTAIVGGTAEGKLVFYSDPRGIEINPDEPQIVVVNRLPADIRFSEFVKGIIIVGGDEGVLSHPAIQARQRKIPMINIANVSELQPLYGKRVKMSALGNGMSIEESSRQDVTAEEHLSQRPIISPTQADCSPDRFVWSPLEYSRGNVGNKAARITSEDIIDGQKHVKHLALGFSLFGKITSCPANSARKGRIDGLIEKAIADPTNPDVGVWMEEIQSEINGLFVPSDIVDEIYDSFVSAFGPSTRLFFRSSSNAEDLENYSGAGDYESCGNVSIDKNAISVAMKTVYKSVWSARAFKRRTEKGIDHRNVHMAILVMEMLPSSYSFVIHTKKPESKEDEAIIEIVKGMGETLVSGESGGQPYRFVYDRRTRQLRRDSYASIRSESVPSVQAFDFDRRYVDYTDDYFTRNECFKIVEEIISGGLILEARNGKAQDIEGSIVLEDGDVKSIYYLQSRDQILDTEEGIKQEQNYSAGKKAKLMYLPSERLLQIRDSEDDAIIEVKNISVGSLELINVFAELKRKYLVDNHNLSQVVSEIMHSYHCEEASATIRISC